MTTPESTPQLVPNPVETRTITVVSANQEITDEQRTRVCAWLRANGIDPKQVATSYPVLIECKDNGVGSPARHIIGFHEYHLEEGQRHINEKTWEPAVYERWVRQSVPLEDDPDTAARMSEYKARYEAHQASKASSQIAVSVQTEPEQLGRQVLDAARKAKKRGGAA